MADPNSKRLSAWRLAAFATLSFPISGVGLPVAVYIAPFYAQDVGLGFVMTGLLFMIMRFWDVVTDPVMGWLVDRFPTRFGRARHWVLLSLPILGLATYFVYMPPREGAGPAYFIVWMLLFYVGFTILQTARAAWVSAIAIDYDDRSRYFQWIEISGILSMLVLLILPLIMSTIAGGGDRFTQIGAMGWALIAMLPVSALLACLFVPDPPVLPGIAAKKEHMTVAAIVRSLKNTLLLKVLALEILTGTAIGVTASNYLFVAESVFGLDDDSASLILIVFFVVAAISLVFWTWYAKRTEKVSAFRAAALLSILSYGIYMVAGQIGGFWALAAGAVINGFAFSAPIAMTRSMLADVIEHQTAATGEDRSGLFFGALSAAYKIGSALAVGAGYLLVAKAAGYREDVENTPQAVQGLLLIFCLAPALLYACAYWLARNYTLDRRTQAEAAAKIAANAFE